MKYLSLYACLLLLICLLATACAPVVYRPTDETVPKMSYAEARHTLVQIWEKQHDKYPNSQFKVKFFKKGTVEFIQTSSENIVYTWAFDLTVMSDPYIQDNPVHSNAYIINVVQGCSGSGYIMQDWSSLSEATAFANALYILKHHANEYKSPEELAARTDAAFEDGAKKYREMPVKPVLPDEIQQYRLAAEDAFNNKDFKKAAGYYEKGLKIEPLWPQGQYMAALIEGELQWYRRAASHMKRYLMLAPDSPNAKAAKDKMLLWEVKAKETPDSEDQLDEEEGLEQ